MDGFPAGAGPAAATPPAYALHETATTLAHAVLAARDFPSSADTTLPHVVLATCGVTSAMGGKQATHAVPATHGLPSAADGPPKVTE